MPSTLDIDSDSKGIFALFTGDSGAGKSVAADSFPNPYIFDLDVKMPSIFRKHFPNKSADYDTFSDIFKVAEKIAQFTKECPYETLIFDSYTSLNSLCLLTTARCKGEEIIEQLRKLRPSTNPKEKSVETQSIDYYNAALRFTQNYFINAIKTLWQQKGNPKHIILIAHVMTIEQSPALGSTATHGRISRSIVTAGKAIAAYIPTQFDDSFYFEIKDEGAFSKDNSIKRICHTQPKGENDAKTSYNLPKEIDFTDKNFFDLIKGKINPVDPFGPKRYIETLEKPFNY